MNRKIIFVIMIAVVLASCLGSKLIYRDDWEGIYTLREYNSCCDSATKIKLSLSKEMSDKYNWKLFFTGEGNSDTLYGRAIYEKKKLKFFVSNSEKANKYFVNETGENNPVFRLEYDNYYTEKGIMHVGHYTRWYNELKDYKARNMLFAGIDYHFKRNNSDASLMIEKENKKEK